MSSIFRRGTVVGQPDNSFRVIPSDMEGIHGTIEGRLEVKNGHFAENKQKSDDQ